MYKTEGIIIKKEDKGEDNKKLAIFSKDYGKIYLIAKSVRKSSSKIAPHVELFSLVDIGFVLGKAQKIITSSQEIKKFQSFSKSPEKFKAASHIAELVFKYVPEEEVDEEIYKMLLSAYEYLEENDFSDLEFGYVLRYFEFRLLSLLGYQPHEKEVLDFFSKENRKIDKNSVDSIKRLFLRYFNNII